MIKLENTETWGFEHAIRGARNPMNSWSKSDSDFSYSEVGVFTLGENDLDLAKRLCNAGSDHRKFVRQIMVSVDITAPLYWWKEFDTYKVGTVANSTSTMHKIHAKEFTLDDFSHEHLCSDAIEIMQELIKNLNTMRSLYNNWEHWKDDIDVKNQLSSKKDVWWQLIQLLPSSYNQMRTVTLNYEVLRNMYHSRCNHKLDEWHTYCDWIKTLPYAKELIIGE